MIELIAHSYCDFCAAFEPEAAQLYNCETVVHTIVQCKHFERCKCIEKYIRKQIIDEYNNGGKNDR